MRTGMYPKKFRLKKEMKALTTKNYENLPEVRKRREEEKKKEDFKLRQ